MCRDCSALPERSDHLSRRVFLERATVLLGGASLPWLDRFLVLESTAWAGTPKQLDVICKKAWGGRGAQGKFLHHEVKRLTVHHSGGVLERNRDAPAQVRSIQSYHQSQGFPDIAYHFIVDRHGNVYKGRPTWARPDTFTEYDTRGHLTVMCLGNFNEQESTVRQVRSLRDLLAWAVIEHDIPLRKIRGHRDHASTACPGAHVYRIIENGKLRRAVARKNERGGATTEKLCGKAGSRRVRAIERGED